MNFVIWVLICKNRYEEKLEHSLLQKKNLFRLHGKSGPSAWAEFLKIVQFACLKKAINTN